MQGRTWSAERNFGILVGGVFAALGGWWLFRGKFHTLAPFVLGLGSVLVVLGAIFPRALVVPNRLWMKLAEALSFVMTRVILGLVFFLVAMPIGLLRKLLVGIRSIVAARQQNRIGDPTRRAKTTGVTTRRCIRRES